MRSSETVILEELERLSPDVASAGADWGDALRRAHPRRPTRHRVVLAIPIVFLAVSLPAVALSSGLRSALGFDSPRPVLDRSELMLSAPVGNQFFAHAWRSPSSTGGACLFVSEDHSLAVPSNSKPSRPGAGGCTTSGPAHLNAASADLPLAPGFSIRVRPKRGNPRNWVPPIVFGSVYSKLHATRVMIEWKGGSHQLVLQDGWFLGGTPVLYKPSFDKFPFAVVAYDANGKAVARKKLPSPSLLMVNGWKDYAREYNAWKKHRR